MASTVNIRATDRVLYLGDSITASPIRYFAQPGVGLAALVDQSCPGTPSTTTSAILAGNVASQAGGSAGSIARPQYTRNPANQENGFPGQDVTLFAAAWGARANAFNPDVIIFESGANDEIQVEGALKTVQDIVDGYTSCISQMLAFKSTTRMLIHSAFSLSEQWQTPGNPVWNRLSNRTLSAVSALVAPMANVALADWNTQHLAWQVAHQPPGSGVSITTTDGVHPTDVGKALMAQFTRPYLTFS